MDTTEDCIQLILTVFTPEGKPVKSFETCTCEIHKNTLTGVPHGFYTTVIDFNEQLH